ncbi:protein phosphatase 2C domain-containing protein [Cohnella panacarvi]|uniref:protein phosphatase 2C domain-containing protein n=1 Tax=Cohnella panacarvi TaxID=400776 RepID=UPI0004BB5683|nr:protein phosphatase 2C domain-containing protein [Cohnella panacarvi]
MEARIGLPQNAETKSRTIHSGTWTYRYGYIRSSDCRQSGDPGQDYVAFEDKSGALAFVVCDGISLSYYGDIAARFAGDKLLDWLGSEDARHGGPAVVRQSLERMLQEAAGECASLLDRHTYPASLPAIVKEALDAKKRLGSGTVFACGRLDPPGGQYPGGRMLLAWLGDVRVRWWGKDGEFTYRDPSTIDTRHQWNSSDGTVGGGPWIHIEDRLASAGRNGELLVYSDGLAALDAFRTIDAVTLERVLERESLHPSSDDMSYKLIRWNFNLV